MELFLLLVVAHFLCDYPLQGNYLAMAKNRFSTKYEPAGLSSVVKTQEWPEWPWALGGHSAIHGGAVALITGYWWIGVLEAISHAIIDDLKCGGRISYNADQFVHLGFKAIWAAIVLWGLS